MENNTKNFNKYVFLSTFARNLIELFVGTILLKKGYSLHLVIYYYLLVNIFSVILGIPCSMISKKYSNKLLSIIGIISFIGLQVVLNFITTDIYYLYIVSFLFALYRRCYWISRRYYTLQVIDNNISKKYSIISILNQLGVMTSTYIGSLLLQFININVITLISIILLFISIYYIYKLDFKNEKNDIKINLFKTIKCTPISSIIHIMCYELQNVVKFLFPLCLVIYVKDTYTVVGLVNLIANISTLIFTYCYGILINKNKNYLKISIMLVLIIKLLQINTFDIILMIVSFIEGLTSKMYEQSFNKECLILSKKFEYHNYNFMYEMVQNISRLIVVSILFFFISDIKIMMYVVLLFISIGIVFEFNTKPRCDNSEVMWKE